ncbi:hypothetical protein BHE74_00039738 [Ensete ventricosum]|nr:hypothetical protein GW17_00019872 [Ensete ventricosum]RWW53743.1 hypothetical protein BHE74_00039738 [Ensete ventricosum]RZR82790.1 hypothetical protein BHM03_00009296 [Ensete ventricosum]
MGLSNLYPEEIQQSYVDPTLTSRTFILEGDWTLDGSHQWVLRRQSRARRRQFYLISKVLLRKPSQHRSRVKDSTLTTSMTASSQTSPLFPAAASMIYNAHWSTAPILGCRSRLSNSRGDLAETNRRSSDFDLMVVYSLLPCQVGRADSWFGSPVSAHHQPVNWSLPFVRN